MRTIEGRRRALTALLTLAVALVACGAGVGAQDKYPSRQIQLVIPYPPGGSDALARKLILGMGERLGQPIVVVNTGGAATQIATRSVVAAAPDGYTLYFPSPHELAAGPALFKSLPFNALTDLTPIAYVADAPYVLLASSALPVKTYAELIAHLKANPDKVRFGSYGTLSQSDLIARRFRQAIGIDVQIIPYSGGSPAFNALLANEVHLVFGTLIPTRSFIKGGQMRPLAVTAEARVPLIPDVPTLKELGIDLVDSASFGLSAPKGLPAEIVARLNRELLAELEKPETRGFIEDMGVVPVGTTPEEYATRLKNATAYWQELVPKLGIQKQ